MRRRRRLRPTARRRQASRRHQRRRRQSTQSTSHVTLQKPNVAGVRDRKPRFYSVRAGFDYRKKAGRREWVRARLGTDGAGEVVAQRFPREGAGILSSLVESEGLVELAEDLTRLEAGTMVDFLPYREVLG